MFSFSMNDRSGLVAVENMNTVLNSTLDKFVEQHPDIIIIEDSTTMEEFVKQYIRDHPLWRSS